jgi:hypothetical protein
MKRALACTVALLASTIIALGQEVVCSLGGFVGPASMKENLKNSSAVVYGDLDAWVPRGGGNVKFSLHVVEVLSGSLTPDSTLNVSYKQFAGCFGPDYEAKEKGIWFLSETGWCLDRIARSAEPCRCFRRKVSGGSPLTR